MKMEFLKRDHFKNCPETYDFGWILQNGKKQLLLRDDVVLQESEESNEELSWTSETEEIHKETTKTGWIDVYERERVNETFSALLSEKKENVIVEFGASEGYMIEEMRQKYQDNIFVATDLLPDGLKESCKRNPDIMHIQCDFTDAPFIDESVDVVFSLNVLEHITEDEQTINECYRILKPGGYCLFVVPRGEKLYDYFDEMLFHKRRYSKGELRTKSVAAGFSVVENFHFAWLCYPAFWLKKRINQHVGKKLSQEEKIKRVEDDIKNAFASPLAISLMHLERKISKVFSPNYGVREFILLKKG